MSLRGEIRSPCQEIWDPRAGGGGGGEDELQFCDSAQFLF